ncbi:MAG: polymer-forming cytoskeletal family protein [Methyloprofundus sp.]|nr:polymer-forming cytoskeletal family protein [Methyloprofundus sp.]
MAIFGRNDNKKSATAIKKCATTIAYGTQIKGEIVLTSSLHIDGEFEGTIHSDHFITISTQGRVIGDIIAKGIIINGLFRGSIQSPTIEILSQGNVKGNLTYHELTIEKGANFEGETTVRESAVLENQIPIIKAEEPLGLTEEK